MKRFELTSTELGKTVEINFAAGDSRKVFASLVAPKTEYDLAVFYYRGDSCGEGGSGICWLSEQCCDSIATGMLSTVLNALHLPGLIVTDGSNGHDGFRKFHNKMDAALNIHRHSDPFTAEGFRLNPIGNSRQAVWTDNYLASKSRRPVSYLQRDRSWMTPDFGKDVSDVKREV